MTTQLQEAFATFLAQVSDGLTSASLFAQEQLPDLIQQILLYKAIISFIAMVLGFLVLFTPILVYRIAKSFSATKEDALAAAGISAIPAFVFGPAIIFCNLDWLMIWLAPKLYLLTFAKEMLQ